MSLIDEALKRARQEAAQQDAARRGAAQPWIPMALPPVRERRSLAPALAGVAVGLLLVAGLATWLLRRPAPAAVTTPTAASASVVAAKPPVADQAPIQAPAPAAPAPAPMAAATAERALKRPLPISRETAHQEIAGEPAAASRTARIERAPAPEPAVSAVPGRHEAAPAPADERETVPAPRATAQPRPPHPAEPTAALEDGKSYAGGVSLPNGHKLELRGIAYSDTQPVVLLNGKLLSPGESVEGYTVVGIQRQRVELKGAGGTVFLTLQ